VVDRVPIAGIQVSATTIDENGTVTFRDASSSSPDAIALYIWNFDDGSPTVTSKNTDHRFPVKGVYNVTLEVVDSDGDHAIANVTITVRDSAPIASFTVSKLDPLEGETIYLTNTSYSYDGITSWYWELGDGQTFHSQNVVCSYPNPGTYQINLTVTDKDGVSSKASRTVVVQDTSPTLGPITTNGGKVTFNMDEQIDFDATVQQALVPITKIAWDFDYNASMGFHETPGISMNQTAWSYGQPREYVVCVRAYDSNSYNERLLTVVIQNVRPVASLTAQESQPGNYSFDASKSWDTTSDNSSLQLRWNFDDQRGWTEWSSSKNAWNNYTVDGWYSVVLEVRDQWGLGEAPPSRCWSTTGPRPSTWTLPQWSPRRTRGTSWW
jgi:PKD repeat protein